MKENGEKAAKTDEKGRLSGTAYYVVSIYSVLGILLSVNQIFNLKIFGFMPIGNAYYYYMLAIYLSISFLIYPINQKQANMISVYDWLLFLICTIATIYLGLNAYNILTAGWEFEAPMMPTIASVVIWILALEAVRRAGGTILFVVCAIFAFYPIYAHHMPGFLHGIHMPLIGTIRYHAMGIEGIIGIPTRVLGDMVIGFIVFGVVLVTSGGGNFFMKFALSLLGDKQGGAAKVSVVSSALMASLSGSVISNVVTTGSVTIPVMKKTGYSPTMAAAIEACASTGGVITPPIMGAAGFLMASFMNVPYYQVMLAAAFPAVLYYFALMTQVSSYAANKNLAGLAKADLPDFWDTLKKGWFYIGSIVLLVFFLIYIRAEAWAPFFAMIFLFACAMFQKETRYTWKRLIDFFVESGRLLANLAAILAGIGLIIGSLSGTGVANAFSRELVLLAQGKLYLLLIFGAFTSFVLGIGMTVTACYIFLAIVLVPALVAVGIDVMAAHMFVLYWGTLSYITPPVALGSIAASTIAGSDPIKTGFMSMRLALTHFIIPFFFVLSPSMIGRGPVLVVVWSITTAIIGCFLMGSAAEGYLARYGLLSISKRIILFVSGIFLLYPGLYSDIVGFIVTIIFILTNIKYYKKMHNSRSNISNVF